MKKGEVFGDEKNKLTKSVILASEARNLIQQRLFQWDKKEWFCVKAHLDSHDAVLNSEVMNKRKTTTGGVENQAPH